MALHYFPGRLQHLVGSKQTQLTTSVKPKCRWTLLCDVRKLLHGLKLTIVQADSLLGTLPVAFLSGEGGMVRIFIFFPEAIEGTKLVTARKHTTVGNNHAPLPSVITSPCQT